MQKRPEEMLHKMPVLRNLHFHPSTYIWAEFVTSLLKKLQTLAIEKGIIKSIFWHLWRQNRKSEDQAKHLAGWWTTASHETVKILCLILHGKSHGKIYIDIHRGWHVWKVIGRNETFWLRSCIETYIKILLIGFSWTCALRRVRRMATLIQSYCVVSKCKIGL